MTTLPSLADLEAAYQATALVARETPLLDVRPSRLSDEERQRGAVAYSSGNVAPKRFTELLAA